MKQRSYLAFFALFLAQVIVLARQNPTPECGTHLERDREEVYLHQQVEKKRGVSRTQRARALRQAAASTNRDFGNIAVIDDADGAVAQRNDFNLDQKTVAFIPTLPAAGRYRVQTSGPSYDSAAAQSGSKLDDLDDDDSRQIVLPFAFPYFGNTYRAVWVNSDGNLTFEVGDANSLDRSLGRLVGGAPRIAPLFTDLNPKLARATTGVRVLNDGSRVVISWQSVPLFSDFDNGAEQTFQIRLFSNGRIEFAFNGINVQDAVTGISPGRVRGTLTLVSLAAGAPDEYSGPVADRFSSTASVDIATVAQKFYATHEDAYDYLVIYNAVGVLAAPGAVAFEATVRNHRTGFGDVIREFGAEYGSKRRLQAILNMGPLYQYPADPEAIVGARGPTNDNSLSVLGHETGHLFLAFASVPDPANPAIEPMLGRAQVHWSFNFNSDASFLEGNRIEDRGPNATPRFATTATVQGYSAFDQYLMGFRSKEEVPPLFLVTDSPFQAVTAPKAGVTFDGKRRDISVDEVIAVTGRRTPDYTVAQRRFRFAFILINQAGAAPQASQIAQVEAYRAAYEAFYAKATSNRAVADTGLRRAVQLSAAPAVGVQTNRDGTATISLDSTSTRPQTFLLTAGSGFVQAPASVTIPAGASQTSFTFRGIRDGVDELTATPTDSSYETTVAKIQVRGDSSALALQLLTPERVAAEAGVPQVVQVRAVDINLVPFAGVRVTAAAPSGTLDASSAVTDESGTAMFRWTATATGALRLMIEGATASTVTVTATAQPQVFANGVVNAASFAPGITPGSLASIFGTGLTGGQSGSPTVQVTVNGIAAQLSFVGDSQINFLVPQISGETAKIEISNPSGALSATVPINSVSPGIFTGENNLAAVLVGNTGVTTAVRPAKAGDVLEIFTTGLGPTVASTAFPGFLETASRVRVLIGNVEAAVIIATTTTYPGLYQINATIAQGTPVGDQPIVVIMNGIRSNEARIRLQ